MSLNRFISTFLFCLFLSSCIPPRLDWKFVENSKELVNIHSMSVDIDGHIWMENWDDVTNIDAPNIYDVTNDGTIVSMDIFQNELDAVDQICAGDVILVTTYEGYLVRYAPKDLSVSRFPVIENEQALYECFIAPDGNVLVWNYNWIKIFSRYSDTPQVIFLEPGEDITDAKIDSAGYLWALTITGKYYKEQEGKWLIQGSIPLEKDESSYDFWMIGDSIWVSTNQRLLKIKGNELSVVQNQSDDNHALEIIQDRKNRTWIFTNNAILRREESGKTNEFNYPERLQHEVAYDALRDLLYISTGNGIYYLELGISN